MILVYNDEGVGHLGLYCLLNKLKLLDRPFCVVDANFIKNNDLSRFKTLIIGGGADVPYCQKLGLDGINNIQKFVSFGGAYIGICAGAYFACRRIEFTGQNYNVFDERKLSLFSGKAIGSIPEITSNNVYYDGTSASKAIVDLSFDIDQYSHKAYYNGGCYFDGVSPSIVVARYAKIDKPAIITDIYSEGRYFLSGVHFEIEHDPYKEYIYANAREQEFDISIEQNIIDQLSKFNNDRIWDYILRNIL